MVNIDNELYNEIKDYCRINNLKIGAYINQLLKKAFMIDKYGETPFKKENKNEKKEKTEDKKENIKPAAPVKQTVSPIKEKKAPVKEKVTQNKNKRRL